MTSEEGAEKLLAEFRRAAEAAKTDELFEDIAQREQQQDESDLQERRKTRAAELHNRAQAAMAMLASELPDDVSHVSMSAISVRPEFLEWRHQPPRSILVQFDPNTGRIEIQKRMLGPGRSETSGLDPAAEDAWEQIEEAILWVAGRSST